MGRRLRIVTGCLAVLLGTSVHADEYATSAAAAETLQSAAFKAVSHNPEVQEAWHAYLAAEDEQRVARGNYLPQVDVSASIGSEDYGFDAEDGGGQVSQTFSPRRLSLSITQVLFDGFATPNEVSRLGFAKLTRYYQLLEIAEEVVLETYRAYQDVRRFRELVTLAENNVVLHQEVYDQILDRVQAGVGRSVDFEQANGRLALAKSNLISERSNLHDVSARYQRIVGEMPADRLAPVALLESFVPPEVNNALNAAYQRSPTVNAAAEAIRAARADVGVRKARFLPRVDLQLRGEYGGEIERQFGDTDDTVAEVVFSYNLFNGMSDQAEVEQFVNEQRQAEYRRIKACRDVRQTVKIAHNDVQERAEQLVYLDLHQTSIAKAREAYRNQFDIGQRTLLDLLDTENEYFEAQRAYVNGEYDYALAQARVLAGIGQLSEALEVRRSDQPALSDVGVERDPEDVSLYCPPEAIIAPAPEVDSDGDGVPDGIDRCPGTPAGLLVDEFGCPLMIGDEDLDGVPDPVDLCWGTPAGTEVDVTGCPKDQPIILKGVNFEFDTAKLTPDSRGILETVAAVLISQPQLKVEVAGHTDGVGSADYNLALSERRAASVVRFLIDEGVDRERLVPHGYGLERPIDTNATDAGRARNRRVELHVLEHERPM